MRHVLRREEKEPSYLLPTEHRHPTFTINGSAPTKVVLRRFADKKAMQTGQAKARGSSPFWEGVLVLPKFSGSYEEYGKRVAGQLREWATEYQRLTGHAVLHIAGHLDEGAMLDGEPHYNEHAHVQIDRTDPQGRVIKLGRAALSAVQDMTARVMGMERGETLEQRQGKRGRKHMGHHDYRRFAAAQHEADLSYGRGVDDGAAIVAEDAARKAQMVAEAAKRREAYLELRGVLKGSGRASQAHYSALKKLYEGRSEYFERLGAYVQQHEQIDVQGLLDYLDPPAKEPEPDYSPTR